MRLTLVPLLQVQRDLLGQPKGMERFWAYIKTLTQDTGDAAVPSLGLINPMAKPHVADALDALLAMDAERVAQRALDEALPALEAVPGAFHFALVVADPQGGWSDRDLTEAQHRFQARAELKRGWASAMLWALEPVDEAKLARVVKAAAYRAAHRVRFGEAATLGEAMAQEGRAARFAGVEAVVPEADLARWRTALAGHLDTPDFRVLFAGMHGDPAARRLGHTPLGVPHRAGYAVALAEARQEPAPPERCLDAGRGAEGSA